MRVSVVIIHYNTPQLLKKQLLKLTAGGFEIIVVDNASTQSLSWVSKEFPGVLLLQNNINKGFAFAGNQGALHAKREWILFLNPDIEIEEKQLQEFLNFVQKNNFDACSPDVGKNYRKPLPSLLSLLAEFTPLKHIIPFSVFRKYTLVGGCLLIKRGVFLNIGGWDERFFLWFEDSDLTKRLLDNNYKAGRAKVDMKHEGGSAFKKLSLQRQRDIFFHNLTIYAKKHFGAIQSFFIKVIASRYTNRCILPVLNRRVYITVPNMRKDLLINFFEKNNQMLSSLGELIVVSSGLTEETVWEWRRKYPHVRFIFIRKNRGVASTINVGFRVSAGEWVGTVNDDTVLTKDWIQNALLCTKADTGSVNPIIYKSKNVVESAGVEILKEGKARARTEFPRDTRCMEVDTTNGAAVLYRKEALNTVGLFDERFGSYLEDVDLSLRLKRRGYKNVVSLIASVTHIGQQTSVALGRYKRFLDFKNWILVIAKNWTLRDKIIHLPSIFVERLRNIYGIIKSP